MTKEAMTMALEALKDCRRDPRLKYEHKFHDKVIKALEEALDKQEHDLQDTRCECCGYMTYQREHMGCIRSAKQEQRSDSEHMSTECVSVSVGEPVAWMSEDECTVYTSKQVDGCFQHDHIPLYTTPQPAQKPWVGLTDDEIDKAWRSVDYTKPWDIHRIDVAKAIEAKLKEKNNVSW